LTPLSGSPFYEDIAESAEELILPILPSEARRGIRGTDDHFSADPDYSWDEYLLS